MKKASQKQLDQKKGTLSLPLSLLSTFCLVFIASDQSRKSLTCDITERFCSFEYRHAKVHKKRLQWNDHAAQIDHTFPHNLTCFSLLSDHVFGQQRQIAFVFPTDLLRVLANMLIEQVAMFETMILFLEYVRWMMDECY